MPRVLVIEEEADISRVIELNLAAEGLEVSCCDDGLAGLERARSERPDLLLLDLMLPGLDGLSICRALKADEATRSMPIIMVTAKGEERDIVLGLGLGAEDYIPKPFRVGELIARVKAALRRQQSSKIAEFGEKLQFDGLVLDLERHQLTVDGKAAPVTATEFRLLERLLSQPGRVHTREVLIDNAIGDDVYVNERTIDTHLSSLRRKLGPYRGWIKTVWGVGYRFEPEQQ